VKRRALTPYPGLVTTYYHATNGLVVSITEDLTTGTDQVNGTSLGSVPALKHLFLLVAVQAGFGSGQLRQ
jgi:hypothetical protein